jgi:hypothetical protein
LQKCKHVNGKVPFFHELKSSQKTLLAWVHVQRLHTCKKAQGESFNAANCRNSPRITVVFPNETQVLSLVE